jgi:hypothetical protein
MVPLVLATKNMRNHINSHRDMHNNIEASRSRRHEDCHTRFWKVNRMRTMYMPRSEIHVHNDYIIGHHHTMLK